MGATPRALRIYLPLHDPAAVAATWSASLGEQLQLTLRGSPGYDTQPAVQLAAVVAAKHQGDFGRSVRLDVPNAAGGTLHVAITDKPPFTVTPRFWRELGLEARAADAIVQKALFHYRIFYVASSFRHLAVHTDGASSLERVYQRPYAVPTYPIDQPSDWRPYDPLLRDPTQLSAPRRATA